MKMQVYIANLGKYTEGELVGAWFTPPIDMEEVKERIGLSDKYEEIAIHDYEFPFEVHEYTPISEINRLSDMVQEIEGPPLYDALSKIDGYWFNNIQKSKQIG
ncbi:antirestriction protein ArdA [Oceanobacillus sp. ISL-73]|nr:antirestriction protein ArdA [Oceanobacillus sp. ISL-74]MBT2651004.1 antirestriction protein ArdA [Oceanobacillus sp. ISL-73]